ncbi:tyrosine-type recombinase/integrase [Shewanella oncorhynchi]|uniref:tyrosine-type recombinase/integrase n=1 Tax=Shewanella TaxID=22 RepID=UPI0039AEA0D9
MSRADALTPAQINRVLKTCLLMQHSEGKRCAVALSHAALRVTEIALLRTEHVLFANGKIRDEIHLPACICKFLKSRTIWLTNKTSRAIIQEWIEHRLAKKWGVSGRAEFQGLIPESRFLYTVRGAPYSLQPKSRKLDSGEARVYWACDSPEQAMREIYKKCGLHSASSHSGRNSLCTNAVVNGVPIETVARILGHASPETTIDYFVIQAMRIEKMCSLDWI